MSQSPKVLRDARRVARRKAQLDHAIETDKSLRYLLSVRALTHSEARTLRARMAAQTRRRYEHRGVK